MDSIPVQPTDLSSVVLKLIFYSTSYLNLALRGLFYSNLVLSQINNFRLLSGLTMRNNLVRCELTSLVKKLPEFKLQQEVLL